MNIYNYKLYIIMTDFYSILGVDKNASDEEIKKLHKQYVESKLTLKNNIIRQIIFFIALLSL